MDSLQDSSIKIKKKARNTKMGERNYICGGCQRAYKSYPALYLHIKRKHNGVRPVNTRTSKPISPISRDKIHTGRPQKVFFISLLLLTSLALSRCRWNIRKSNLSRKCPKWTFGLPWRTLTCCQHDGLQAQAWTSCYGCLERSGRVKWPQHDWIKKESQPTFQRIEAN